MFVRISRSRIKPERLDEFKTVFAQHGLTAARKQEGYRWGFALPPNNPADQWLTISGWDSRAAADAYQNRPDRRQALGIFDEFYIERPTNEGYDDVIE